MIPLDDAQQLHVERLLLRRGVACPQCGSPELASDGTAMQNIGNVSVKVSCTNRGVEHPQGFGVNPSPSLSDDEAREVGIIP
jgi:hypothetical protein